MPARPPSPAGRGQPCNGCSSGATLCRLALARLGPCEHSWGMAGLHHNSCLQGEGWKLFPKAAGPVNARLCRELCCSFTHPQHAAGGCSGWLLEVLSTTHAARQPALHLR